MEKAQTFIKFWLPVFLWAIVIFIFSGLPTQKTAEYYWQDVLVKKLAHLGEYAIFFILCYRALRSGSGLAEGKAGLISLLLVVGYALSDEFHQSLTPGREPTLRDVIIDAFGGSLAWLVLWKCLPKMPKKLQSWANNLQIN